MHEELILLGDSVAKGVVYDAGSHRYVYTSYSFLRLFCEEHGFTTPNLAVRLLKPSRLRRNTVPNFPRRGYDNGQTSGRCAEALWGSPG